MGARQVYENQFGAPLFLWGSKVHDFISVPAGGEESTTLTVPGAALGDLVLASVGVDLGGTAILHGYVSAADTVTVVLTNLHATNALDLASTTLRVLVIKAR